MDADWSADAGDGCGWEMDSAVVVSEPELTAAVVHAIATRGLDVVAYL